MKKEMKMLNDRNREMIIIGTCVTLFFVIYFGYFGFVFYQNKQIENNKIEYCREMKIQPKDCK